MLYSMSSEFAQTVLWYLLLVALGWGSFPLAYTLFRHFPDRGFAFAKIQGLLLVAYLSWIAVSLGIVRYQRGTLLLILFGYLAFNLILLIVQFSGIRAVIKKRIRLFLLIEGLFLVFFVACVAIRMYNPDLTGAEKEADFTFLNAILRSPTFPPKDTWFAGTTINYYYFGYLIWATVIKLTGVISPIGFNLALASIVALSATGAFGLAYQFTQRWFYGVSASFLLTIMGNLDGAVQILQRGGYSLPFDWWRSSRVIPDTINEFPYFSFLLGDLHAHFMAIPFALLLFGLCSQFAETLRKADFARHLWLLLLFLSVSLGGSAVINGWDYPTYLLIAIFCTALLIRRVAGTTSSKAQKILRIVMMVLMIGVLMLFSRFLFWPFFRHFIAQLSLANIRFVASAQRTGLTYFLVIHGLFLWITLAFIASRFRWWFTSSTGPENHFKLAAWNSLLLLVVLSSLFFRSWVLAGSCLLGGVFLYLWHQESGAKPPVSPVSQVAEQGSPPSGFLPYLLLFMAFAILAGCEVVYIKDFYGHPLERQNTIFKFYYQAWILLSLGTPYLLDRLVQNSQHIPRTLKHSWVVSVGLLCCAGCAYPIFATYEKTNRFRSQEQGGVFYVPTLNGISYIAYRYPYEYDALLWIDEHLEENAVILEATGKPYSFFGRVATTTGRSTVLGWGNHESLWRDQTWQSIMERTEDIKQMYDTVNKPSILPLLRKYHVNYIYVGALEYETYTPQGLEAFAQYFETVYANHGVKIYKVL